VETYVCWWRGGGEPIFGGATKSYSDHGYDHVFVIVGE
jgi:hypothetical protein